MLHSPCDTAETLNIVDRQLMSPSLRGVEGGKGLSPSHQTFLPMMHLGAGGEGRGGVVVGCSGHLRVP